MELTQPHIKKEINQGSRTIRLEMLPYKKLRAIQSNMATDKKVPSFSYIINLLIEKNKYYHEQLKEIKNVETK